MTLRSRASVVKSAARAVLTLAALSLSAGCESLVGVQGRDAEFAAASRAVDAWVHRHADAWTLNLESGRALTRPAWSQPCAANPPSGFTVLRYEASDAEIDLLFRCPVDGGATVQQLQAAFAGIVLQTLPHGIRSSGWEFRVLTPSSTVEEGVTFQSQAGQLRVAVETPLYAVYGRSLRDDCMPPADAPMEPGCYLNRQVPIPLRLTIRVPASLSALN
jgi:hypothetical protein